MNFFIKQNGTFPLLKYPVSQRIREQYDITDDMFENIAVTFSMIDADSGEYRIANVAGDLFINENTNGNVDNAKYELTYHFKEYNTCKAGRFFGEFTIDFMNSNMGCFKLKLPTHDKINIIISDSITKTTVV